jgi:hypothetical protein
MASFKTFNLLTRIATIFFFPDTSTTKVILEMGGLESVSLTHESILRIHLFSSDTCHVVAGKTQMVISVLQ